MAIGFTVKFSYSKTTHYLDADQTNFYVKLRSNNSIVKQWGLGGGLDISFDTATDKYQFGTITGWNGSFNRTVDLNLSTAGIYYDDATNKIIGTDDLNDEGVTKYTYQVSAPTCPVRIIKNTSTGILTITAPCDSSACNTNPINQYYQQIN